jgi:single-strand DNA-binding protein
MADNTITIVGNITREPELKFLPGGQASVRLGVAVNRRWQNRQTNEMEERTSYFDVTAYGSLAENVANSCPKGTRVVVSGRLEQRSWDDKETGAKRSIVEINADDIAPSLRYATAQITKNPSRGDGGGYQSRPAASSRPAESTSTYGYDEEPF